LPLAQPLPFGLIERRSGGFASRAWPSAAARDRHRDATLILIGYRHGLQASEIADLEWSQVAFSRAAPRCTCAAFGARRLTQTDKLGKAKHPRQDQ
jgi:hypothetical protein